MKKSRQRVKTHPNRTRTDTACVYSGIESELFPGAGKNALRDQLSPVRDTVARIDLQ